MICNISNFLKVFLFYILCSGTKAEFLLEQAVMEHLFSPRIRYGSILRRYEMVMKTLRYRVPHLVLHLIKKGFSHFGLRSHCGKK